MKLAKNKAKAKQHPEAELLLFENNWSPHPRYRPKIIGDIKMYKKQLCLFKRGYMINGNKNEAENEQQIT